MATYAFAQKYFANARMLEELEKEKKLEAKRKEELEKEKKLEAKRKRNEGKSIEQLHEENWREHYIELQK